MLDVDSVEALDALVVDVLIVDSDVSVCELAVLVDDNVDEIVDCELVLNAAVVVDKVDTLLKLTPVRLSELVVDGVDNEVDSDDAVGDDSELSDMIDCELIVAVCVIASDVVLGELVLSPTVLDVELVLDELDDPVEELPDERVDDDTELRVTDVVDRLLGVRELVLNATVLLVLCATTEEAELVLKSSIDNNTGA